jgi:RNA polymerase sigma factor (sigma-70 family)
MVTASQTAAEAAEAGVREVYLVDYGPLAGWATILLGDRGLAEDVVVEAFARLLQHWQDVHDPHAWLYATVANLVHDHWRRRGREAAAYERLQAGVTDPDVAPAGPDRDDVLSVREAVQTLPERLRVPVLLRYFADLSVLQVAHQLGRSEGAVKRDLHDARTLLAQSLGSER